MTKLKLILLLILVCFQITNAQNDYPVLTQIVTDNAGLFSQSEKLQLKEKLTAYETRTAHQLVVLTINSLGNDTVENYAYQTFNQEGNRLGQANIDNGILILVAKNNRKFRIEVGNGLTPIITDLLASRINRSIITPAFKEGDYFRGIDDATSKIIKLIDDPIYAEEFANYDEDTSEPVSIITKFFSAIFLTLFFGVIGFLGYNKFVAKNKSQKISIKYLYLNNKTKFVSIWLLAICIVIYFNAFFWYAFLATFITGFLSVFVGIGFFVILKGTYERAVSIFTTLFTGKLGVIIFPFYLPITILLLFAGFIFTFLPILMGAMFVIGIIFNQDINSVISGIEPIYFLFFVIGIVLLFFIITAIVAYKNIKNDLRESFGFSFFKIDTSFLRGIASGSSRSYSSSGSSSYSSSSSSSSFSGGGGSSSGGGASGSW